MISIKFPTKHNVQLSIIHAKLCQGELVKSDSHEVPIVLPHLCVSKMDFDVGSDMGLNTRLCRHKTELAHDEGLAGKGSSNFALKFLHFVYIL